MGGEDVVAAEEAASHWTPRTLAPSRRCRAATDFCTGIWGHATAKSKEKREGSLRFELWRWVYSTTQHSLGCFNCYLFYLMGVNMYTHRLTSRVHATSMHTHIHTHLSNGVKCIKARNIWFSH